MNEPHARNLIDRRVIVLHELQHLQLRALFNTAHDHEIAWQFCSLHPILRPLHSHAREAGPPGRQQLAVRFMGQEAPDELCAELDKFKDASIGDVVKSQCPKRQDVFDCDIGGIFKQA